jgi:predicted metal-dependent peptidase
MPAKMASLEKKFKELLRELKWRYRNHHFFSEILSELKEIEIEFNKDIKTAHIKRTPAETIKIEISPHFFSTYVKTPEDLLFLLSHETLHYILGHLTSEGQRLEKEYGHKIANAAMDIIINQMIYRELRGEKLHIINFYKEKLGCPHSLFVPPYKIKPRQFKKEECKKWYDMIISYSGGRKSWK